MLGTETEGFHENPTTLIYFCVGVVLRLLEKKPLLLVLKNKLEQFRFWVCTLVELGTWFRIQFFKKTKILF
jgi:hypothetical protein